MPPILPLANDNHEDDEDAQSRYATKQHYSDGEDNA
jgi:hypothetical protein